MKTMNSSNVILKESKWTTEESMVSDVEQILRPTDSE
jgi:hypothetical protein